MCTVFQDRELPCPSVSSDAWMLDQQGNPLDMVVEQIANLAGNAPLRFASDGSGANLL